MDVPKRRRRAAAGHERAKNNSGLKSWLSAARKAAMYCARVSLALMRLTRPHVNAGFPNWGPKGRQSWLDDCYRDDIDDVIIDVPGGRIDDLGVELDTLFALFDLDFDGHGLRGEDFPSPHPAAGNPRALRARASFAGSFPHTQL
ncbi:MAG: hypothetical protein M3R51_07395 [Candidatus Eremiobacteraeota bacterium]|nr:hypothetical protein [Candidatus Eremiobacteraeota bacterium]